MGAYRGWGRPSYRSYGGSGGFGFGYRLTPVVKKLIIANAAVFLLVALLSVFSLESQHAIVRMSRLVDPPAELCGRLPPIQCAIDHSFGLVPDGFLFRFRFWQPLTYLFLHGGFWHLFFNMFALWMFGTPLERDWGRRRFLKYYFLTGVGAGLLGVVSSLLWGGRAAIIPTIGASGAIYGILLAFGLLYPHAPILFMLVFPIPARIFVLIFGVFAFLGSLGGMGSGVSHISHLGGMLFGFIYLRGGWRGIYSRALSRYVDWRLKQSRRKFEVYMREQDEREERHPRPDRWVN